jgi:serine O-acetyltransferase
MSLSDKKRALQTFMDAVRGDYGSVQRYRAKYHAEKIPMTRMPVDFVRKVGFQTITMVRAMQLFRDLGVPVAPQVLSRLIRHLYSAEIHWDAQIAPGVSIVHGVGLVISHAATIGEGCILFHNVTLGEGVSPETREVGAPKLGKDVHIGPGATLIGPIEVGDGTKIMAGAVLTRSVPPGSLVKPADAIVTERQGATKDVNRTNSSRSAKGDDAQA